MVNTKLQGNYNCEICGERYYWQDGLNDCRAAIISGSKHINGATGKTEFEIEVEGRCPCCKYLIKEITNMPVPGYIEK